MEALAYYCRRRPEDDATRIVEEGARCVNPWTILNV